MAPELEDLTDPPADLASEIRGMRVDLRAGLAKIDSEGRGRKLTKRLAAVVLVFGVFVGGVFAADWVRSGQVSCGTRNNSRADSRAMTVAIADNTVKEIGATDEQRAELRDSNERVALELYPPIAC